MIDKIKELIAKLIIKDETEYCAYCIMDTISKNIDGLSYDNVYNAIGEYFTPKIFNDAWYLLKFKKYIVNVEDTDKYMYGIQAWLNYDYDCLL